MRLIGIGLVVVGVAAAFVAYQRTLSAIADADAAADAATGGETATTAYGPRDPATGPAAPPAPSASPSAGSASRSAGSADPPPRYLAFRPGIRSGLYAVADLPGSRDRDVEPDRPPGLDYPPETDLVPHHSQAALGSLAPGLYATAFGVRDCGYELRRINKSGEEVVIGQDHLFEGRVLVTINEIEPDSFRARPQCGDWSLWSPLAEPLTSVGNGDYWVGDLAPGTWDVPEGCVWEEVVAFRGAELVDVEHAGMGPEALVVDDETLGLRIRGCTGVLTRR